MLDVLQTVFSRPLYWIVTFAVAICTYSVMVIVPQYSLLASIFLSPVVSVISKLAFLGSLYGVIGTNYTYVAAAVVVSVSVLFGINTALLLYYIRSRRGVGTARAAQATSLSGVVAAAFSMGCAACGSAVLLAFLQLFGAAWMINYLPLHGTEFGLIGVALLLYTTYTLAKAIHAPKVCTV